MSKHVTVHPSLNKFARTHKTLPKIYVCILCIYTSIDTDIFGHISISIRNTFTSAFCLRTGGGSWWQMRKMKMELHPRVIHKRRVHQRPRQGTRGWLLVPLTMLVTDPMSGCLMFLLANNKGKTRWWFVHGFEHFLFSALPGEMIQFD